MSNCHAFSVLLDFHRNCRYLTPPDLGTIVTSKLLKDDKIVTKFECFVITVLVMFSKFLYLEKRKKVGTNTKLDFVHCTSVFHEVAGDPSKYRWNVIQGYFSRRVNVLYHCVHRKTKVLNAMVRPFCTSANN